MRAIMIIMSWLFRRRWVRRIIAWSLRLQFGRLVFAWELGDREVAFTEAKATYNNAAEMMRWL
jgi:hypothetical protein